MDLNAKNPKKLELVSPAGNHDQLIAAINAGADAVYLGYKKFSARAYADNFEISQLKKAVKISNENGVKVYLALNTLVKDFELKEVLYFLNDYLGFCQDGIILQDLGLFKIIRDIFPGIRLHASTQINIHNLESALLLGELGFKRIILAREMTLEEISYITKNCDIEIEVFTHGSQCYSYSGSCYFSSFTGTRSGNRGRCTQPCRMKYSLSVLKKESATKAGYKCRENFLKRNSYLISKADLCALQIIPELCVAGVDALKIEGRMKTPEYVGIVTKIYRKYIDLYYKKPRDYRVDEGDIYRIKQIFSRELGTGYYLDKFPEKIVSFKKSGSIGNFLGRVVSVDKKFISISSKLQINKGDYLEIWTNRGNEQLKIGNFETYGDEKGSNTYKIKTDREIKSTAGDRVFKFFDESLDNEAKNLYIKGIKEKKGLEEAGFQFKIQGYSDLKLGRNNIEQYLNKDFYRSNSRGNYSSKKATNNAGGGSKLNLTVEVYSLGAAFSVVDSGVKNIVINNFSEVFYNLKDSLIKLANLKKIAFEKDLEIIIKTPHIIYDSELVFLKKNLLGLFNDKLNSFSISNAGILKVILDTCDNAGAATNIYLNYMLNIFNHKALSFFIEFISNWRNVLLKDIALSPELSLKEIEKLIKLSGYIEESGNKRFDYTIYSYGYFPVMESRFKMDYLYEKPGLEHRKKILKLIDPKGYEFFMVEAYNDNIIFLNSKKICNLFDLPGFYGSNIDNLYIDTRLFDIKQIKEIVEFYRTAVDSIAKGQKTEYDRTSRLASKSDLFSNYTKGHFFREVM